MADDSTHANLADSGTGPERGNTTAPGGSSQGAKDTTLGFAAPVARLYRHALETVFGFLTLEDLSRVLSVSRSWSSAVRSMPCIGASLSWPQDPWPLIAASALVRHVRQIGRPESERACAQRPDVTSNDLLLISRHFGSLTALSCTVKARQPPRLSFGPSLLSLELDLTQNQEVGAINDAIVTISRLPRITHLKLVLSDFLPALSFAPLAATAQLQTLRLYTDTLPVKPTLHHLDQLRALSQLHTMVLPGLSNADLASLLRLPHSLQWQQIHQANEIDDDAAAALSSLPSLTMLDTDNCRSVGFLHSLRRLRTLSLRTADSAHLAADIAAGLACCVELTDLKLEAQDVTSKHLSQALSHLPLLRSLQLRRCCGLESLSFLSECSQLAQSLQCLNLLYLRHAALHSSELAHILTLKNLTSLFIRLSFVEPLDARALRQLQPPSVVLPKLERFQYLNW